MDGRTIEKVLKKDIYTRRIYQGIYSEDTLKEVRAGYACVVNSSPAEKKGEHWFVVSNLRKKNIEFLCSYRSNPKDYPNVYKVLKATGKKITQLPRRLQGDLSSSCGPWCLFFFYCLSRHFSANEISSHFFSSSSSSSSPCSKSHRCDVLVTTIVRPLLSIKTPVAQLLYNEDFIKAQENERAAHNDERR